MQINNITLPFIWALRQIGKRVKLRGWERMLQILFNPEKQKKTSFQIPLLV